MKKVYIAAPVVGITPVMRAQIDELTSKIENLTGFTVYKPWTLKIPNAWGMSLDAWAHSVFTMDVVNLQSSDIVVVCDYGRHGTVGTAWEAGYAFALGKEIQVVKMPDVEEQSLMVKCCSTRPEQDFEDFQLIYNYEVEHKVGNVS